MNRSILNTTRSAFILGGRRKWGLLLAAILFAPGTRTEAAGRIVDCVQVKHPIDAIPGVVFNEIPYAEYRGRFQGSLTLPYDATGQVYKYDMPVWIIAPANLADGNGTVVVDPLHTNAVTSVRPSGSEGEQPLALKILGPRFLFRSGTRDGSTAPNFTWVGLRWDPRSLTTPFPKVRYDHAFEQFYDVSPGTLTAPADRADAVGKAMLADLADELRRGVLTMWYETEEQSFAKVKRVIAFGESQIGRLLRQLLNDPPSLANGGGAHHVPLFDGWFIGGAAGTYDLWPTISESGEVTFRKPIIRRAATPPEDGLVIEMATEQDIGRGGAGNELVRFADSRSYRSYEIAGASHFSWGTTAANGLPGAAAFLPDLADSLVELAAISGVSPDFKLSVTDAFECVEKNPLFYVNPLDWNPVARALFSALDDWIVDPDSLPPPSMWLLLNPDYSPKLKRMASTVV